MKKKFFARRGAILPLALLVAVSLLSCENEETEVKWLTITNNGIWERDVDVSDWQKLEDAIEIGHYPWVLYYPWQGEDTINYKLEEELLWVNGKVVGIIYDTFGSASNDSLLPAIVKPEDIVAVKDYTIDLRKLKQFPNLLSFCWGAPLEADFNGLKGLPRKVRLYVAVPESEQANLAHLPNLRGLLLLPDSLKDPVLDLSPLAKLKTLRMLALGGSIDDTDFKHIGKLHNLRELTIGLMGDYSLTLYKGLQHLRGLRKLEVIKFYCVEMDKKTLKCLTGFRNLKVLWLLNSPARITDEDYELFTEFPKLHTLYLDNFGLGRRRLEYLGEIPHLRNLWLSRGGIDKGSWPGQHFFRELERLRITERFIDDSTLVLLGSLRNLRGLDVYITYKEIPYLKRIPNLEYLSLTMGPIHDSDLKNLGELTGLHTLELSSVNFASEQGWLYLAALTNLRRLDLTDTNVDEAIVKQLKKALPNCEITCEHFPAR